MTRRANKRQEMTAARVRTRRYRECAGTPSDTACHKFAQSFTPLDTLRRTINRASSTKQRRNSCSTQTPQSCRYTKQDVLLETVAGPVRLYLQGRKDTVRCIVASLTDETSGDLYEELRRQASGRKQTPRVISAEMELVLFFGIFVPIVFLYPRASGP